MFQLPSIVSSTSPPRRPSGGQKRKWKQELPKVLILVEQEAKSIIGAMLLNQCFQVGAENMICFTVGGCALLAEPLTMTAAMRPYVSSVFSLTAIAEATIRRSECTVGGTLNEHFAAFTCLRWRCWLVDVGLADRFRSGVAFNYFKSDMKYVRGLGIDPIITESLAPHLAVAVIDTVEAHYHAEGEDSDSGCGHGSVEVPVAPRASEPGLGDVDAAVARMRSLCQSRGGGAVSHSYPPDVILTSLRLHSRLKGQSSLSNVISDSAALIFGHLESQPLRLALTDGSIKLPSWNLMLDARVRLDILNVLYERLLFLQFEFLRYYNPDSSPQLGLQWLAVCEDRFALPKDTCHDLLQYVGLDLNDHFQSRLMPLSTYGRGHGTWISKHLQILRINTMESSSDAHFLGRCRQVRGIVSDQGVERNISLGTTMLPTQGPTDSLAYPLATWWPEHLHIIYNCLQRVCSNLPFYNTYLRSLRTLETFLNDKGLRDLFRVTCLGGADSDMFKSHQRVHIDWRWEFLSISLESLLPRISIMAKYFDYNRLAKTREGSVDCQVLKDVRDALGDLFEQKSHLLLCYGKMLEFHAHALEGCRCHASIWTTKKSHAQKIKMLKLQSGHSHCVWKNRNASWFQCVGFPAMLQDIDHGHRFSSQFQTCLNKVSTQSRALLLAADVQMKHSMSEELTDKFAFHNDVPYIAAGIFYGETPGGCHDLSRAQSVKACDMYDDLIANGKAHKLPEVAHIIFSPFNASRRGLDAFGSGLILHLRDAPSSFCAVQPMALQSLTGRGVERIHALIKRVGATALNVSAPFVCAQLRETNNLALVRTDANFYQFALKKWRSRNMLDEVLRDVPKHELEPLTRAMKIHRIYQCSQQDEYRDTSLARQVQQQWQSSTQHLRSTRMLFSTGTSACVSYLRGVLRVGHMFSLPAAFYEKIVDSSTVVNPADLAGNDAVQFVLDSVDSPSIELDPSTLSSLVFFDVVQQTVAKRFHVPLSHRDIYDDEVAVNRCSFRIAPSENSVMISNERNHLESLRLLHFVADIQTGLPQLFHWSATQTAVVQMARRFAPPAHDLSVASAPALPGVAAVDGTLAIWTPAQELDEVIAPSGGVGVDDWSAHACLTKLSTLDADRANAWVPFSCLADVHMDVVTALARVGAVETGRTEFGELQLRRSGVGLRWGFILLLEFPIQVIRMTFETPASKLDIIAALHREGWRPLALPGGAWSQGQPLHYHGNMARPVSYFMCLLKREEVLRKGVESIRHGQKDAFYMCLLRLSAEKLVDMFAALPEAASNDWFKGRLGDDDTPHDDVDDRLLSLEDGHGPDEAPRANVPPLALAPRVVGGSAWSRCFASVGDGSARIKVYFDNASHTSGRARGWVNCSDHGCIRYIFADDYDSRDDFCAFAYTWLTTYTVDNSDKPGHLSYTPTPQRVQAVRDSIVLIDF
jgi:hypothetical protein